MVVKKPKMNAEAAMGGLSATVFIAAQWLFLIAMVFSMVALALFGLYSAFNWISDAL